MKVIKHVRMTVVSTWRDSDGESEPEMETIEFDAAEGQLHFQTDRYGNPSLFRDALGEPLVNEERTVFTIRQNQGRP